VLEDGTNSKSIVSIVSIKFAFIFIEFEDPRIITIVLWRWPNIAIFAFIDKFTITITSTVVL